MYDATLNETIITTEVPRELIEKLRILEEHDWHSFDKLPKLKLLPDDDYEANLLGLTLYKDNTFVFISDFGKDINVVKKLAMHYKFSFHFNFCSFLSLNHGRYQYDHITQEETLVEINDYHLYGAVTYDKKTQTFLYEGNYFKYREELMEYLMQQKVRDEKLDIILGDKAFSFIEGLPSTESKRSLVQKISYKIRVLIVKYGYAIKNILSACIKPTAPSGEAF